jgi:hypothetical protein
MITLITLTSHGLSDIKNPILSSNAHYERKQAPRPQQGSKLLYLSLIWADVKGNVNLKGFESFGV